MLLTKQPDYMFLHLIWLFQGPFIVSLQIKNKTFFGYDSFLSIVDVWNRSVEWLLRSVILLFIIKYIFQRCKPPHCGCLCLHAMSAEINSTLRCFFSLIWTRNKVVEWKDWRKSQLLGSHRSGEKCNRSLQILPFFPLTEPTASFWPGEREIIS